MDGADQPARHVLGIAGSPRRHGNSESLLDACLEGVAQSGAIADKLVVAEYGISPCRGCNACSSDGVCALRDRMHEIYPMLDAADAIVVATPVFFATVPAVLKALYDRCQPYWARRFVLGRPAPRRRSGAVLVVGGGGDPYGSECAVTTTASVMGVLGVHIEHRVVVEHVDVRGDLEQHPDAIEEARRVGTALGSGVSPAA